MLLNNHRPTGHCGVLAIATYGPLGSGLPRAGYKEERGKDGQKGRFNIFATAGLRTQSAPVNNQKLLILYSNIIFCFIYTKNTN